MSRLRRLDVELVRRGLARSRQHAGELVGGGRVTIGGRPAGKPATQVDPGAAIELVQDRDDPGYASRGGYKLAGALDGFAAQGAATQGLAVQGLAVQGSATQGLAVQGLEVAGRDCLDAGASTGGFTDVLLRRGASRVIAVDVGYGQLAWRLRQDARVSVVDRQNVRELVPEHVPFPPSLLVADLSFISLRLVLPALACCAAPHADLVLMVKPQFEVGRDRLGARGVVRDPALRAEAVLGVARAAGDLGWGTAGVIASPLPGPSGNVEYFLWLRSGAPEVQAAAVQQAVREGPVG